MRRMMGIFTILILAAGFSAGYGLTGDEVLNKVEDSLTGPQDMESLNILTLANSDGSGKEVREMKMYVSGNDMRVVKFTKPAGVNGIGLLVTGADQIWIYLPEMKKIKMIQGSFKNDSFQGTDFSYNEIGSYEYKKDYSASIQSEDDKTYTLVLTRKAGSEKTYGKVVMIVDKSTFIPSKAEFYDGNTLKKVMDIIEVEKMGKYDIPVKIKVEDVVKKHYTEMVMKDVKFDQGLKGKGIFTQQYLKKKE
jgi:outer membrane lipoprotein-sorting protein